MAGIGFPSTYVVKNGNGLGPRTIIIKLAGTNLTSANLASVVGYLTTSHGSGGSGDSAFTVAGVGTADGSAFESGVTDDMFIALQGTGEFTAATADMGISGLTITTVAVLDQA